MSDMTPEKAQALLDGATPRFLIRKHGGYYKPNCQGYTSSAILAGRYTEEKAIAESHPNGPNGPRDGMSYTSEDAITDEDYAAYVAMREQRDDLAHAYIAQAAELTRLCAQVAAADKLAEPGGALIDFHNGPAEAKRPDIWQRLLQRFAAALSAYEEARK